MFIIDYNCLYSLVMVILGKPLWSKLSRSVVVSHRYLSGCQLDRDIQPWTNSTIWLSNQMGMG